jgi:hypothetical protein
MTAAEEIVITGASHVAKLRPGAVYQGYTLSEEAARRGYSTGGVWPKPPPVTVTKSSANGITITFAPGRDMEGFDPTRYEFHFSPSGWEPEPEPAPPPPPIECSARAKAMTSTSRVVFTAAVLPDMDPDACYGTLAIEAGYEEARERWLISRDSERFSGFHYPPTRYFRTGAAESVSESWTPETGHIRERRHADGSTSVWTEKNPELRTFYPHDYQIAGFGTLWPSELHAPYRNLD